MHKTSFLSAFACQFILLKRKGWIVNVFFRSPVYKFVANNHSRLYSVSIKWHFYGNTSCINNNPKGRNDTKKTYEIAFNKRNCFDVNSFLQMS